MAIGELRALPVGRGQIGKVKYISMGVQGRGQRGIPSSVIKTGIKLPQFEDVNEMEKVITKVWKLFRSMCMFCCTAQYERRDGAGGPRHL